MPRHALLPLAALWLLLVALALYLRPLWPVDETRYLSVAWEMWARGDFLVPYLNGAPYSHKPPLLFWLMQGGWAVFGVNDWWPRLVPPLFALASVFLTARLARALWPARQEAAATAAWILFGSLLWTAFATLTMFDMLMTFFTLAGMLGLVRAWQGDLKRGFGLLGVAIGLGVLAKGPVILLHTLPAALLAPWWMTSQRPALAKWYGGIVLAILLGAVIALAWALPAAYAGGPEYRDAIFWGQTAGRMASSFAHRSPWWWYLPLLPLILFPWFVWPVLWRALAKLARAPSDPGVRFLWAWWLPAFLAFCFISGKQPQYLLPLFPAFALLAAYALHTTHDNVRRTDMLLPAIALLVSGVLWGLAALNVLPWHLPVWAAALPWWPGVVLGVAGIVLLFLPLADLARRVRALALASALIVVMIYAGVMPLAAPLNDPRPLATYLASLEQTGRPLAHFGKYHGQYHSAGRLTQPFELVDNNRELRNWILLNPEGRLISYQSAPARPSAVLEATPPDGDWQAQGLTPDYSHPYRGGRVFVWSRAAILAATEKRD
jgi:4-amino-4-deoxy-L-arabinose transferase-like glycosyltransferase